MTRTTGLAVAVLAGAIALGWWGWGRDATTAANPAASSTASAASAATAAGSASAPGSAQPIAVEEVLAGKLRVRIFSHLIETQQGPISCWTYVSDGLLAVGHKEIALTVKREPGEKEQDYSRKPLELYGGVYSFAARGEHATEGGSTRLDPNQPGLLRDDFQAVLYTAPQPLDGVSTPGPFLTVLLVTGPEMDVAEKFGHVRLSALLGQRYRFYPTAPWVDRKRTEIIRPEALAGSLLHKKTHIQLSGASARLESPNGRIGDGSTVVLRLQKQAAKQLLDGVAKIGHDQGFAVLLDLDPESDACLVYAPMGQGQGPSAISKPGATGTRVAGNMLMIVPGAEQDEVRLLEDGFGLLLTQASWARLRGALADGGTFALPAGPGGMRLSLSWVQQTFDNPVDGRRYVTKEGWRAYHPSPEHKADQKGPVKMTGVRLLTPENEVAQRVETTPLADYIKRLDAVVQAELAGDEGRPGYDVMVQLDLSPPAKARVRIAARPRDKAPGKLAAVSEKLQAVSAPPIRSGSVSLVLEYTVRGGTTVDN